MLNTRIQNTSVASTGLGRGMVLTVNFTCAQEVWVTHLERITYGKLVTFSFLARWSHMFFLLEE